jgi:hypothetical protein
MHKRLFFPLHKTRSYGYFYQVLQNCQSGEKENTKLHVACIGLSPLVVQSNMQVLNAFLLYREKVRGKGIEDAVVRDDVYSF